MALVLVQHIVDQLHLWPTHNVVVLSAFAQIDLRPIVTGAFALRATRALQREGGRFVRLRTHEVEEVHFLAMTNARPGSTIVVSLGTFNRKILLAQLHRDVLERGQHLILDQANYLDLDGVVREQFEPGAPVAAGTLKHRASREIERLVASRCIALSSLQHIKYISSAK